MVPVICSPVPPGSACPSCAVQRQFARYGNRRLRSRNPGGEHHAAERRHKGKSESDGRLARVYRIASLAPGNYQVTGGVAGFGAVSTTFVLSTNETRNVPLVLTVGQASTSVEVTAQQPLLDTSDSRNQLTLDTKALQNLPLAARNPLALVTLAPGVTGLGASTETTFNPENSVDASANGRGANANLYVVDGLDVTSSIRPGVVNLTPNADSIQEATVQTNTYTVDFGRASSIQTVITSRSGTEAYHGFASDYYSYEGLNAKGEFAAASVPLAPYHINDFSFGVGGPIIPHHSFFFFVDSNSTVR